MSPDTYVNIMGQYRPEYQVGQLTQNGNTQYGEINRRPLAREVSPDTYVNIMGQYRPEHQVGQMGRDGQIKLLEINRRPRPAEMDLAYEAARRAGLRRFDERRPC